MFVWVVDINEGFYDVCIFVDVFFIIVVDDIGSVFIIIFVLFFDIFGNYLVVFYVVDESGNENVCWVDVNVIGVIEGCIIDEEVLVLICYNGFIVIFG